MQVKPNNDNIKSWRDVENFFNLEPVFDKLADFLQPGDTHIEIGLFKGASMACLMEKLEAQGKMKPGNKVRLVGIDPFMWEENGKNDASKMQRVFNERMHFINVLNLIENVEIYRMFSQAAHGFFADGSVSSVFVDGGHDYYDCYMDMHQYWQKLKDGGIMMVHDYLNPVVPMVQWAVDHYVQSLKDRGEKFSSYIYEESQKWGHPCHTYVLRKGTEKVEKVIKGEKK